MDFIKWAKFIASGIETFYSLDEILDFNNNFFFLVELESWLDSYPGIEMYLPPLYRKIYYQLNIFLYGETYELKDWGLASKIENGLVTDISELTYDSDLLYHLLYYPKKNRNLLLESHVKILEKLEESLRIPTTIEIENLVNSVKNKEITKVSPELLKKEEHFLLELWYHLHEENELDFYKELSFYCWGERP